MRQDEMQEFIIEVNKLLPDYLISFWFKPMQIDYEIQIINMKSHKHHATIIHNTSDINIKVIKYLGYVIEEKII